jgi:probable HAF family extracellular repeat protein
MAVIVSALVLGVGLGAVGCTGDESATEHTTGTATVAPDAAQHRWLIRAIDLYEPRAINERGQVVGAHGPHPALWEKGKVRDLGALRKGELGRAVAINDRGQVVGRLYSVWSWGDNDAHSMDFSTPFLWQRGRLRDLGLLSGPVKSWPPPYGEGSWGGGAAAINNRGQIVGWSDTRGGDSHAALWQNGKMRDLGTLGGDRSFAVAINDRGQVIGSSTTRSGDQHAFLWEKGTMRDLGTLGGASSEPAAINDRGQVVGSADTGAKNRDGDPIEHAFLWEKGKMIDLGTLGGDGGSARAINERGQIVGWSETGTVDMNDFSIHHAFFWQNGNMRDLGTLGGDISAAAAINDHGQIVGEADTKARRAGYSITHAFLWENGKMRDLGTLDGQDSEAIAINEKSQIIGLSFLHAVLWTPQRG